MSDSINVLAELERIGWDYLWASETTVKVKCAFHDDKHPSGVINIEKRNFRCYTAGCDHSCDFISFLARALKTTRAVVYADLASRYKLETAKIIEGTTVERYHAGIWKAQPFLKALHDRGITNEDIRAYRLGEDRGRITIPIKNAHGVYVNVRRYLPGAPGPEKMRNTKGHGTPRLYPIEQMTYSQIAICGGELKAIAAAKQLNPAGIGAVCVTAGEGDWPMHLNEQFRGKERIWVCYDIDDAGQKASMGVCNILSRYTPWIGNVALPLDRDAYPTGDVNDFIVANGDLVALLKATPQWLPAHTNTAPEGKVEEIALSKAFTTEGSHKRLQVKGVVSAMDQTPYIIPSEVLPVCDRSQKFCSFCPVYSAENQTFKISPESPALLEMVNSNTESIRSACMSEIGVPSMCRVVSFEAKQYYNIEEVRLSPELEMTARNTDRAMLPAIAIGKGLELNETYFFTGRMHPHPSTQQSTLVISGYEIAQDALSSYTPSKEDQLTIFSPEEWTVDALQEKLNHIYEDLAANVTRIYQRQALHLIIDLVYHSPLFLPFDGRTEKGWLEALIVGDSSQGKSEATKHLMHHYGLGAKVECKNASVAGLLGGLQQIAGKWFVTWGVIPTHDKRLVVMEEVKGASQDVLSKLTDMRSSGIAEIPKIEKRRAHARTRLIWLSNPRSNASMSSYNYGIEVLPELIGGLEDIRRFDVALIVSANEIDPIELNKLASSRPSISHVYTSDLCRALVLWVWTRDETQIEFTDTATQSVLKYATKLCEQFTDSIPLIDRGSMRTKLARLAAALAGRTFSCKDNLTLLVRECHVEYVYSLLVSIYSSEVFGYDSLTAAIKATHTLKDPERIQHHIENTPFPQDVVDSLLHTTKIELQDIQDWCGWDRNGAMQLVSFLVRKRALARDGRAYRKTPEFIRLLKGMDIDDRPSHIPEDEDEF